MVLPSKQAEPKSITLTSEAAVPAERLLLEGSACSEEDSVVVLSPSRGLLGVLGVEVLGTNRMFSGFRSQ